ncbi:hypothetical protein ACGYK3_18595 [Sulfitobacter sp. 1A05707]|jgi:hypothetical protein|uniref:hypothetical protein n=1 Tax=Sulfitobacter sp. 1A05707 TaxID=3368560 RepID=UPI003745A030|tara:strand:- start:552 stop:758 length:207 start_codon:yes stop_codon:yes gene_type:complete
MAEYCLSDFVDGYNRLNKRQFSDLSYKDIRELMTEYGAIDPMISQTIHDAYIAGAAGRNIKIPSDVTD